MHRQRHARQKQRSDEKRHSRYDHSRSNDERMATRAGKCHQEPSPIHCEQRISHARERPGHRMDNQACAPAGQSASLHARTGKRQGGKRCQRAQHHGKDPGDDHAALRDEETLHRPERKQGDGGGHQHDDAEERHVLDPHVGTEDGGVAEIDHPHPAEEQTVPHTAHGHSAPTFGAFGRRSETRTPFPVARRFLRSRDIPLHTSPPNTHRQVSQSQRIDDPVWNARTHSTIASGQLPEGSTAPAAPTGVRRSGP